MVQHFLRCVPLAFVALTMFLGVVRADEPIVLRYKLEKGATLFSRVTMENKTTQTIAGNNIVSEMGQTVIDVRVLDDLGTDGVAKIKSKTERLKATTKVGPLGAFEFDSQKAERDKSSPLGAALTPLYERLIGSELQMEVTPRGTVKNLTGYAQLVGDLIKENPLVGQFAGGGTDKAAEMSAQGQWLVFPEKAVKPGDKWENPLVIELAGLGTLKGKETVTFLSLESRDGHSIAKFSVSTDISFELNLDMMGAKVTGKVTTSNSTGSAEFNVTTGRMLKQVSETTLSGDLSVVANNMTIPVPMTQTVKTEMAALDKLPE